LNLPQTRLSGNAEVRLHKFGVRASCMGGIPQFAILLSIAAAIVATFLCLAFLVGKLFESKVVRKRIIIGAIVISAIGVVGYFGFIAFILSGNLN
jgi:hypothetical protein